MIYNKARAAAAEYRRLWGKEGGYVFVWRGEATGWSPHLTPASNWLPGVLAIADTGELFEAFGEDPERPASARWGKVHG